MCMLHMKIGTKHNTILSGKDLQALLPTGFWKTLIFQVLVHIKEIMTAKPSSIVVICSLQSIVYDYIEEASSMRLTAALLWSLCNKVERQLGEKMFETNE